ncbi:MAG TPA: hypothetical protein DCZ03_09185 [Gammaproteobacteria bacterium]|nr:hypothetical protein [Gammaproteobacteria bacterium]
MYRPDFADTLTYSTLRRRLAALVYDSLAAIGIIFIASLLILPFSEGEALDQSSVGYQLYRLYLLLLMLFYFAWSWSRGQTLGMRSWRLYLVTDEIKRVSFARAAARFIIALLLPIIGYTSLIWRADKKTIPDLILGTNVLYKPK